MENRVDVSYDKSRGYENTPPVFSPKIPNPISLSVQMNLSPYISMNYEPRTMNYPGKNKPNSNPIKPNFLTIRPIVSSSYAKSYEIDLDFWPKNPKPKTNPFSWVCSIHELNSVLALCKCSFVIIIAAKDTSSTAQDHGAGRTSRQVIQKGIKPPCSVINRNNYTADLINFRCFYDYCRCTPV